MNIYKDLLEFHAMAGVPVLPRPTFPPQDRISLRMRLIDEEYKELMVGIQMRDIVEVADAIADLIYVATGMALEFGIPLPEIWAEVQRTNMAKRHPETGTVKRRADGKILKPTGWMPPDIESIIARHS